MGTTRVRRVCLLCGVLAIVAGCFPPPLDQSDVADTEIQNGPNACGGLGALTPGEPGLACGPCLDGELVCDPSDPDKTRTVCEGDSARNACNGCEPLEEMPGANCGRCGQVVCDGTTGTTCAEPATCDEPLTCADLRCVDERRTCTESDGQIDARCGECIETHVQIDGACLGESQAPADVTATTDLDDRVVISWSATQHATAYRVFRCPGECDDRGPWTDLLGTAVTNTSVPDQTVTAPPAPPAPTVTASTDRTSEVSVTWSTVTAPASPRFTYRVIAVAPAGESAPSQTAVGRLADRAITGYELKVESGSWQPVEGFALTDTAAPAPTLVPGTVNATQGLHPDKVVLALTGWASTPGAERTYQVRARTRFGVGEEGEATGRRRAGPVTLTWERSAGSGPQDFGPITGASGPVGTGTHEDTDPAGIPPFGVVRHYRARLEAEGAAPVTTGSVAGWRTPLPGVPQIISSSTHLPNRIELQWSRIEGATGYRIYRNGALLELHGEPSCDLDRCSYVDNSAPLPGPWAPPANVFATTTRTSDVTVSWSPVTPPRGSSQTYEVAAVGPAGEGLRSAARDGWVSAPELEGYEVKASISGSETLFTVDKDRTSFEHSGAPFGSIAPLTLSATQAEHRDFVRVISSGGTLSPASAVSYTVRGHFSAGTTAWSSIATGQREVGPISRSWEYSEPGAPSTWLQLPESVCPSGQTSCDDTSAPSTGATRIYRLTVSAAGATSRTSQPTPGGRLAFSYFSGGMHTMCAVDVRGRLWTWGRVEDLGSLEPRIRAEGPFSDCTAGGGSQYIDTGFGCARRHDGDVLCGSFLNDSELSAHQDLGPGARSIRVGLRHACAVRADGGAVCWGAEEALGDGRQLASATPVTVLKQTGEPLTGLGEISVGRSHSCARTTQGTIWCWGASSFGQLGLGTFLPSSHAVQVPNLSGVTALSLGDEHSCVRLTNGELRCFGRNIFGALGEGSTQNRPDPTPVLASLDPDIYFGQSQEVVGFGFSTCARVASQVFCWGDGSDGRLGFDPGPELVLLPTLVSLPGPASMIGAGAASACAIIEGGLWCWGHNGHGALGDGTTTPRATPGEVTLP